MRKGVGRHAVGGGGTGLGERALAAQEFGAGHADFAERLARGIDDDDALGPTDRLGRLDRSRQHGQSAVMGEFACGLEEHAGAFLRVGKRIGYR